MLFDSEYKLPNENFRVINDEDPIKKAALEEARRRYERLVEKEKKKKRTIDENWTRVNQAWARREHLKTFEK